MSSRQQSAIRFQQETQIKRFESQRLMAES